MAKKDTLIGRQLDEYRLTKRLGQGGMARVYLAQDVRLKRQVAIKVIDPPFRAESEYMQRFEREAQAVARLEHTHVVRLYRYGDVDGLLYMAMQYVDGPDLRAVLAAYSQTTELIEPGEACRVMHEVCAALDYAHSQGVIHRDVKPSNILLDGQGRAYLADFGLVRLRGTGTQGRTFGSPHYMAPEQAISSASVVPQSDLYAIGVILYQMFTGHLPFDADSPTDIAMLHMTETPRPPSELRPEVSTALEAVILRALSKEPGDRYASGSALVGALEQALQITRPSASSRYPTLVAHPGIAQKEAADQSLPPLPPAPAAVVAPDVSQTEKRRLSASPDQQGDQPKSKRKKGRWGVYPVAVVALVVIVLGAVLGLSLNEEHDKHDTATSRDSGSINTVDCSGETCQDADEDGVVDTNDRCPDEVGLAVVDGCILEGYVVVTQTNMNVILRSRPSINGEVMGWLRDTQWVTVLGRDSEGDWLRVRAVNNADGVQVVAWVAENLIEIDVELESLPVLDDSG